MSQEAVPRVDVACVVVAYRSGDILPGFLDSIELASPGIPVLIVNNDVADDEPARIAQARPTVRAITSASNLGYGGGANLGVAESVPSDWIIIANPDVTVDVDAIVQLLAAARRFPDAGILGPRILNPDGTVYPSARALPTLRTGLGHALFANVSPSNPWTTRYHAFDELSTVDPSAVGWLSGAFLFARRELFEKLGGFDERFLMYFEDTDLGRRVGLAGMSNLYVPAAMIVHEGGHSTRTRHAQMTITHHRSAYRYVAGRHPEWYVAPIRWGLRLALFVRARWEVFRGRVS
ncbi:MAG TPA: glycosyltransferase family 2 protein [Galbitalea sp.]